MKQQQGTFAAIMQLLADRKWHTLAELAGVSRYPKEWVRELLLEDVIEVSTDASTFEPLVRIAPSVRSNGHPSGTAAAV